MRSHDPLRDRFRHLAERPVAPAVFLGWLETLPSLAPLCLWTIVVPLLGHPAGSTVCTETLEAAGYQVTEPSRREGTL